MNEVRFPKALRCLFQPARYKFIRGGRGSGKSWGVARALLLKGTEQKLRILCTREVQKSIKQSVHQLLSDQIKELGLEGFYTILQTEIRGVNGTQILFSGLSDLTVDSIKSFEGVDLVWIEEAQSITGRSLKILVPTIRKEGSEIWATYNPELDTDPIHQMAVVNPPEGAVSLEMNYSDNPWFTSVLEQERLHAKATMPDAEYLHVWEGKCLPAVEGAIYANEVAAVMAEHRLCRLQYDPMLKVHCVWDLGYSDFMSIIMVQRLASEIRIIDYIEDSKRIITDYAAELDLKPWNWGVDYLPHDGYAERHQTGKADADVLRAQGRTVPHEPPIPSMDVEQGIRNARLVFPRVYFNESSDGVKLLLEHLKRYRRNINRQTNHPSGPRHDEHSHAADAFRYLCLVADQLKNNAVEQKRAPRQRAAPGSWMG